MLQLPIMFMSNSYLVLLIFFIRLTSLSSMPTAERLGLRTQVMLGSVAVAMTAVFSGIQLFMAANPKHADNVSLRFAYNVVVSVYVAVIAVSYLRYFRLLITPLSPQSPMAVRLRKFVNSASCMSLVTVAALVMFSSVDAQQKPEWWIVLHAVLRTCEASLCALLLFVLSPRISLPQRSSSKASELQGMLDNSPDSVISFVQ